MAQPNLKFLILSAYDVGGASIAAIRLHLGLLEIGVDSRLLTLHKSSTSIPQHFQFSPSHSFKNRLALKWRKWMEHRQKMSINVPEGQSLSGEFSMPLASFDPTESEHWDWADVVNLHWVNEWIHFETLISISGKKPLIWTMHDMHAFTGGCHYSHGCAGMLTDCPKCPILKETSRPDLARQFLQSKKAAILQFPANLTITAPSQWMLDWSQKSALFQKLRHVTIPNGLDTRIFRPISMVVSREALGLPLHKKIMLCVVQSLEDERKGFQHLVNSLMFLPNQGEWLLCTVGKLHQTLKLPVEHLHFGSLVDERLMAMVYNAADVFVHPAVEDNLPNVILEAIACGTPVAGFQIGGMQEMVKDKLNGKLSLILSANSLADCILEVLARQTDRNQIAEDARNRFDFKVQAHRFKALAEQLKL